MRFSTHSAAGGVLRRLDRSGLMGEYPNLSAYVARGEARPADKRAFDARLAVFTSGPGGSQRSFWTAGEGGTDLKPKMQGEWI